MDVLFTDPKSALLTAQLFYDLLDKMVQMKCTISVENLLTYQAYLDAFCATASQKYAIAKAIRKAFVQRTPLTDDQLGLIEGHIVDVFDGKPSLVSASLGLEEERVSVRLLHLFWKEMAEIGERLSEDDVSYVECLLQKAFKRVSQKVQKSQMVRGEKDDHSSRLVPTGGIRKPPRSETAYMKRIASLLGLRRSPRLSKSK